MHKSYIILFLLLCSWTYNSQATEIDSVSIQSIRFHGNYKTVESNLLRAIKPYEKGTRIAIKDTSLLHQEIHDLLYNTELFNEVKVESQFNDGFYDLKIGIWERFPIIPEGDLSFADRNINVWMKEKNFDLRRINLGVGATHHNFLGRQQKIGIFLQAGYTPKITLRYENPYLDKDKKHGWGFETAWSANKELNIATKDFKQVFYKNEDQYIYHHFESSLFYQYKPDNVLEFQIASGIDREYVKDEVFIEELGYMQPRQNKFWTWKSKFRLAYNQVDHWNYPLKGWRSVIESTIHVPLSNQEFWWPFSAQFDYYYPLSKKWYFSTIHRFGWHITQGKSYPFQRNMGYDQHYIRGFESYVFDGQGFYIARENIKYLVLDWKYNLDWKYFEVIPLKILIKGFADQGVYWDNPYFDSSEYSQKALYSFGMGIDILTLYGLKFRIEYSFNNLLDSGINFHRSGE